MVFRETSSGESQKKLTTKAVSTSSVVLSINSIKVLDHTKDSMFQYLLKIPRHSLCLYARKRVVSETSVDIKSIKRKEIIESSTDKIALVLDMQPLKISVENNSVNSLREFADQLSKMIASKGGSSSKPDDLTESVKSTTNEEKFLIDYISIERLSIQLKSRSSTNLSIANYIPDLNINLSEKYYEVANPIT